MGSSRARTAPGAAEAAPPSGPPPASPRHPGPPADLGAGFLEALRRGVAAVAWEDGASEPVHLELRAGAPSAPGAPLGLGEARLHFVDRSTSLFRRRKQMAPPRGLNAWRCWPRRSLPHRALVLQGDASMR